MLHVMRPRRGAQRFFTLTELLVVVVVIVLLSALAIPLLHSARSKALITSCMANLRKLALASSNYQLEHNEYPPQPSEGNHPLPQTLGAYVDNAQVFHCPVDQPGQLDSYSSYYVRRTAQEPGDSFLLGCPRHANGTVAINVFRKGNTSTHTLGETHYSAGATLRPVFPGDTISAGTTYFPDGSSATITTPGLKAQIVESFRLENGQTYTMIKIPPDRNPDELWGTLIINVIPGSRFEVVTPSAIAGVRGTVFRIDIFQLPNGTPAVNTFVYEGRVVVTENGGKGERMASWGVPIRCDKGAPPYVSPDPVPALPGVIMPINNIAPTISRENPPWVMGSSPWKGGPPPWAPASGWRRTDATSSNETTGDLAKSNGGNNGNGNGNANGQDQDRAPATGSATGNSGQTGKDSGQTPSSGDQNNGNGHSGNGNSQSTPGSQGNSGQQASSANADDPDATVEDEIERAAKEAKIDSAQAREMRKQLGSLGFLAWLLQMVGWILGF